MRRTAFISFFSVYPPTSGAAAVAYNSARHAGGERLLIQMGASASEEVLDDALVVATRPWPAGRWRRLIALRPRIREMVERVTGFQPDLVVLEGASWVMYHWLFLRDFRRVHRANIPLWYHGHNVEYILRKQKHGRLVKKLTRWAEGRLLRGVDRAFAVSAVDRQQVRELYGVDVDLWPNGVDVAQFADVPAERVKDIATHHGLDDRTVLFMGAYVYQPNREALEFLFHDVMPRVRDVVPEAKLAVLGGDVPHHADWLINPGRIPHTDLPAFIKACGVGTAPIFSGSGTRLKILEYLAAGLPVVSTPKGAEGLALDDGACLLLAKEADFAGTVANLLTDRIRAAALGEVGQQMVRERYDWPVLLAEVGLGGRRWAETEAEVLV